MRKRHDSVRSFLSGVLVTVLAFGLMGSAVAASVVNKELYYNGIHIRLNGKTLIPRDAAGNEVEPFIIDGTTYLPVRAVGDALGLNVSWDGASNTVILGNDPELKQPAAWLGEMETFTGSAREEKIVRDGQYNDDFTANNGATFDRYYYPSDGTGTTYLLKGQYTRFTATLYLSKFNKDANCRSRIQIFLDDKLVYTSPEVGAGIEPVEISVPLNGAYKMEIVTQGANVWNDGTIGDWYNGRYASTNGHGYYNGQLANAALWND